MAITKNKDYTLIDDVPQAKNQIEKLRKAKEKRDDEFYTLKEDVLEVYELLKNVIPKFDYILCPADSEESNFVKVLKENNINVQYCQNIYAVFDEERKEDNFMVLTNPPFSLNNDWIPQLIKHNIKFFVLSNILVGKDILEFLINDVIYGYGNKSYKFKHISGKIRAVPAVWLHNIQEISHIKGPTNKKNISIMRDDEEQIVVLNRLNDFYLSDYYRTQDRLYVPITYLYTNGFDGYKKISVNHKVIVNGKKQFIKILIEREDK